MNGRKSKMKDVTDVLKIAVEKGEYFFSVLCFVRKILMYELNN